MPKKNRAISFFNKCKSFFGGLPPFDFMIYVKKLELIQVVRMARNLTLLNDPFSCYSLNISLVHGNRDTCKISDVEQEILNLG